MIVHAARFGRPSGAKHRQNGNRIEREIVDRHKALGVKANSR